MGRGKDAGRVAFRVSHPKAKDGFVTLFRLKSNGAMKMGFGRMIRELPSGEAGKAVQRLLRVIGLPTIQKWYDDVYVSDRGQVRSGWLGSNRKMSAVLADERSLTQFKQGILQFKKECRDS